MRNFEKDIKEMIEIGEKLRKQIEEKEKFKEEVKIKINQARNLPIGGESEAAFLISSLNFINKGVK